MPTHYINLQIVGGRFEICHLDYNDFQDLILCQYYMIHCAQVNRHFDSIFPMHRNECDSTRQCQPTHFHLLREPFYHLLKNQMGNAMTFTKLLDLISSGLPYLQHSTSFAWKQH